MPVTHDDKWIMVMVYQSHLLLVGTYVKGITITIMKGGETGVVFWSKVYLSI